MELTTSWEEHQVTREEAGRGSYCPPIQEVDHVTHRVPRSEQSLKVHAAERYWVPVRERAENRKSHRVNAQFTECVDSVTLHTPLN